MLVEGLTYHADNRAGRGEAPFKLDEEAGRFRLLPLRAYLTPLIGRAIPNLSTMPDPAPITLIDSILDGRKGHGCHVPKPLKADAQASDSLKAVRW